MFWRKRKKPKFSLAQRKFFYTYFSPYLLKKLKQNHSLFAKFFNFDQKRNQSFFKCIKRIQRLNNKPVCSSSCLIYNSCKKWNMLHSPQIKFKKALQHYSEIYGSQINVSQKPVIELFHVKKGQRDGIANKQFLTRNNDHNKKHNQLTPSESLSKDRPAVGSVSS